MAHKRIHNEYMIDNLDADDVRVKHTYRTNGFRKQLSVVIKIATNIFLWYSFSIAGTAVNKRLMSDNTNVQPIVLTFFHVLTSCILDYFNMSLLHHNEFRFYRKTIRLRNLIVYFLPLTIAMLLSKILTYTSYGLIPVSLAHTIKSLQSFFNVIMVFLWTGDCASMPTILSLFPIVYGVIYASVNEIEFQLTGCVFALLSTVIGVWQGIYLKSLMHMGLDKNYIHLMNCSLSCLVLCPVVFVTGWNSSQHLFTEWRFMLLSSILQYFGSLFSYSTMHLLTPLSYSICSTFKRISIILYATFFFHRPLSSGNVFGIAIASFGAVFYNIATKSSKTKQRAPNLFKSGRFRFSPFINPKF